MRSRYSAYAVKNVDYLLATHAPEQREPDELKNTRAWADRLTWLKLEVLGTKDGAEQDTAGEVQNDATMAGYVGPFGSAPATSNHPGGVNVCFTDGSVKFIKDSISLQTWWALGTRAGGEVVSADSF